MNEGECGQDMLGRKLEFEELICDGIESLVDGWRLFLADKAWHFVCRREGEMQEVSSVVDGRGVGNDRGLVAVALVWWFI